MVDDFTSYLDVEVSASRKTLYRKATTITITYIIIGFLWILFSDKLLFALVSNAALQQSIGLANGWVYVLASGLLVFRLTFNAMDKQLHAIEKIQKELTIKKDLRESLQSTSNSLTNTINKAPFPVILYTKTGKLILVNDCWEKELGYGIKDMPTLDSWVYQANRDNPADFLAKITNIVLLETEDYESYHYLYTNNEEKKYCMFSATIVDSTPNREPIIRGLLVDLSKTKKMEETIENYQYQENSCGIFNCFSFVDKLNKLDVTSDVVIQLLNISFSSPTTLKEEEKIVNQLQSILDSHSQNFDHFIYYHNHSLVLFINKCSKDDCIIIADQIESSLPTSDLYSTKLIHTCITNHATPDHILKTISELEANFK